MPEGDTVWRTAHHLDEALAGQPVERSDFRVPAFATLDLAGSVIEGVVPRGKHLLTRIGDVTVHTHLKMEGSWHLYRPGTRWQRPAFQARVVLDTPEWQAVGFSLGIVEVLPRDREDEAVGYLGPDLLDPAWDSSLAAEAAHRVTADPAVPVAVAMADQRNLAGLGNEYINELCFLTGVVPTTPVGDINNIERLIDRGRRLIVANRDRVERTFTGDTRRGRQDWVFSRGGQPCRRCGTRILEGQLGRVATQERNTFWCPSCQR